MIPVRYNLRSLMVRRTTSMMTALGVALVVMTLFILLGLVAGLRATMANAGAHGNWVVLSRGVTTEPWSYVTREQYEIIRERAEAERDSAGTPLVSPETVTAFNPTPEGRLEESSFTYLRGVYPIAYEVHSGIKIDSGRLPVKGRPELIVGRLLAARFPWLTPGHTIHFGRRDWTIVGIFSDRGSARESEVWSDLDLLAQDVHFGSAFSSLHVALRPGMDEPFAAALTHDSRLNLDAISEPDFYGRQSRLADQMRDLGMLIGAILGIGAAFGGMNTMYAAVARRTREIGVLRALGFSRADILASFAIESVALAFAGGVVGEVLGVIVAIATGLRSRIMNVELFIFSFRFAPPAFLAGLAAAAIIGVLGGLLPAWRAARIEVSDSLRAA